jgi:hypothetical protein
VRHGKPKYFRRLISIFVRGYADVETFLVDSWLDYLRQHERVTNVDRVLQTQVQRFQLEGMPKVTHMIAAERA